MTKFTKLGFSGDTSKVGSAIFHFKCLQSLIKVKKVLKLWTENHKFYSTYLLAAFFVIVVFK